MSIIRANENGPGWGYFRSLRCFASRLSQGALKSGLEARTLHGQVVLMSVIRDTAKPY